MSSVQPKDAPADDNLKSDDDPPNTMFTWMAHLHNPQTGSMEHVVLCAAPPSQPPSSMASCDLETIMALKSVAQRAANAIGADISLHAFDGGKVLVTVHPELIERAHAGDIVLPPKHH